MREFLAWVLILCVIGMWVVVPSKSEPTLKLFNASSDEELLARLRNNRRFMASFGLVILLDVVAVALALVILV